jgi:hypothetical protein
MDNKTINPCDSIKKLNINNKVYIIRYSIVLITISLVLAIIGILDYHYAWTSNNSELLVALYGINWGILALNIMYYINTRQRSDIFGQLTSICNNKTIN